MQFEWVNLPINQWQDFIGRAGRSNLIQSWPYARASHRHGQVPTRFATINRHGKILGGFQVQVAKAMSFLQVATLDRGPLWFDEHGTQDDWREFLRAFDTAFPRRFGRRRRVMLELEDGEPARKLLREAGFKRVAPGYQTVELDLTRSLDDLNANLKSGWRQSLNKAARAGLTVDIDAGTRHLPWLLARYDTQKADQRFGGAKPDFLTSMAKEAHELGDLMMIRALDSGAPIAAILVFVHGTSATYQVGWTSDRGRSVCATHLLLWTAVGHLQERGIERFDLGGINDASAPGVTQFKQGLNGTAVDLVGIYY